MPTEFKFPDVGEGVTEGTLLSWLVETGDAVEEDESLAEVETDKAVVEVPAPHAGTIQELHAEEGATIKVGDVLVTLGEEGETASDTDEKEQEAAAEEPPADEEETASDAEPAAAEDSTDADRESEEEEPDEEKRESTSVVGVLDEPEAEPATAAEQEDAAPEGPAGGTGEPVSAKGRVLATPATRRYAREQDVDITQVEGTGPGGRVTEDDIDRFMSSGGEAPAREEDAAAAPDQEPAATPGPQEGKHARLSGNAVFPAQDYDFEQYGAVEREELSRTRRAIGEHMERAKYVAPHVTAMDDADVTELWAVREKQKQVAEDRGVHLTFLPFIAQAVIASLKEYPMMNASLDERTGELVKKQYYNIGVAVATDRGLLVPVLKDADDMSIMGMAKAMEEKADAARNKELTLDEMRGGSFTLTNYGSIGGRYGTPIINYPEVGILGIGTIRKEPVVVDDEVEIRRMLPLSLSFDHRVIDGAYAARFMNSVIHHLEDPDLLLIDE